MKRPNTTKRSPLNTAMTGREDLARIRGGGDLEDGSRVEASPKPYPYPDPTLDPSFDWFGYVWGPH